MADGFLERFPDLSSLLQMQGTISLQANGVGNLLGALGGDSATSPLAALVTTLHDLDTKLDVDLSGLSTRLPQTLDVIQNALPPDTLAYVQSIDRAYHAAQDFLQNSALVKAVPDGSDLQTIALAAVEQILDLFNSHLDTLTGQLIDLNSLTHIQDVFASVEQFRTDFSAHRDQFLPFMTENLIGVAPDLLEGPLAQLDTAFAVLAPLEPDALAATLNPARQPLIDAFNGLATAIDALDPADAAGYVQIQVHLDAAETALDTLLGRLNALYQQIGQLITSHPWETIFSEYLDRLAAVRIESVFSIDHIIDSLVAMIEELLAQLYMTLGVDDLTRRVQNLRQLFRDAFVNSALGQVRQTLLDYLDQIRQAIESVPTEQIQTTVENMLQRVKQELDALGIEQIGAAITNAFQEVDTFVTTQINDTLTSQIQTGLTGLASQVQNLRMDDLFSLLTDIAQQVDDLMAELEQTLGQYMNDLEGFAAQLDQLSFKPVSDEVIGEIDDVKRRLQAINPDALSEVEKVALGLALTVLESIDLESKIVAELKSGFSVAQGEIKSLLGGIADQLDRLRKQLDTLNPDQVLGPLLTALQDLSKLADKLNGKILLNPLVAQVDKSIQSLNALAPGQLLDPLQAPYAAMMQRVNALDPAQWVAPLRTLYAQIDRFVALIDVTPLLEELDRREKALFGSVRNAIVNALNTLNLPDPFNAFWVEVRAVLEAMTDAIFGDPDVELKRISVDLNTRFRVSSLFEPLDTVFDQLITMIEAIPQDDLTTTLNTIRATIGVGLDALEPSTMLSRMRSGLGRLSNLAPTTQLGMPLALPGLKLRFQAKVETAPPDRAGDIATVSARFDAVFTLVDPGQPSSQLQSLIQTHTALVDSLRTKINSLDSSGAAVAYAELRAKLDQMLPDFLRAPQPLTYSEIMTGLRALRPSAKVSKVDQAMARFLARLQPLEAALTPAINDFFSDMREVVMLLNPLSLRDAIKDIYDTLRTKLHVLDPDALADSLRTNFFDPLTAPLHAIDPGHLKAEVNQVFEDALNAVSTRVTDILETVVRIVDEQLRIIRDQIQALLAKIRNTITTVAQGVKQTIDRVERLVFVELMDRLNRVVDNLGVSFDAELDRVRSAFDDMLAAIPLGEGSASVAASNA
jgi:hypothetical protein